MRKIDWDKIKTRLDALLVIDEYLTDPSEDWLRLVIKTEEVYGLRYLIDNGSGDSLSGMMVTRINRLTKIRMAENGCYLTFLIALRDFMSL